MSLNASHTVPIKWLKSHFIAKALCIGGDVGMGDGIEALGMIGLGRKKI